MYMVCIFLCFAVVRPLPNYSISFSSTPQSLGYHLIIAPEPVMQPWSLMMHIIIEHTSMLFGGLWIINCKPCQIPATDVCTFSYRLETENMSKKHQACVFSQRSVCWCLVIRWYSDYQVTQVWYIELKISFWKTAAFIFYWARSCNALTLRRMKPFTQ